MGPWDWESQTQKSGMRWDLSKKKKKKGWEKGLSQTVGWEMRFIPRTSLLEPSIVLLLLSSLCLQFYNPTDAYSRFISWTHQSSVAE